MVCWRQGPSGVRGAPVLFNDLVVVRPNRPDQILGGVMGGQCRVEAAVLEHDLAQQVLQPGGLRESSDPTRTSSARPPMPPAAPKTFPPRDKARSARLPRSLAVGAR